VLRGAVAQKIVNSIAFGIAQLLWVIEISDIQRLLEAVERRQNNNYPIVASCPQVV
jgi:hypothetical protein